MSNQVRAKIMGKQHEDIKYLQTDDIGGILAKGLAETYEARPKNPIEFFAKWLLNSSKTKGKYVDEIQAKECQEQLRQDHRRAQHEAEAETKAKEAEEKKAESLNEAFWTKLRDPAVQDLNDHLSDLTVYLERNLKATGVYIGKLEPRMKEIQEDDDDKAHLEEEPVEVIKFKHATPSHQDIMVNAVLNPEQGICHDLFVEAEDGEPAGDDENEEDPQVEKKEKDILETEKFKYVSEVVTEPKIHYWRVPRLGSFMCIPLVYNSCLFEDSVDAALTDFTSKQKERDAQDAERKEFDDGVEEQKEAAAKSGEAFEPEVKEWPEIANEDFATNAQKFVVCIDTLGQDRPLTDEQKRFALTTTSKFRELWEIFEKEKVQQDIDLRIVVNNADRDWFAENGEQLKDNEEKATNELVDQRDDIEDDDHRRIIQNQFALEHQAELFTGMEEFKERLTQFKQIKVIKYGKFMQALLYFLGYEWDSIVEKGTQKFFWKSAKLLIDDQFFDRMSSYQSIGAKEGSFKKYQTVNYVEQLIEGIDQNSVDEFNLIAGRLLRWLLLAIENRKADIIRRKALIQNERDQRDQKIAAQTERKERRESELTKAQEQFAEEHKDEIEAYEAQEKAKAEGGNEYDEEEEEDEEGDKKKEPLELPVFDSDGFLTVWDEENPEIIIQDQLVDDIDNDWVLTEDELQEKIKAYLNPAD